MNKVVIIGCGNVGMSYAYALLNQKANVQELVLIDIDKQRIEGEVMDLNHCLAFAPSKIQIKAGDYGDCKDATIIMIAAGANQKPGETRMDLIKKNTTIFKQIIKQVMATQFHGIFLIATNPLDIMTYITWKESKLPYNQVIGSGTSLDTARLRYLIGEKLQVNPKNVHGYVIGEHGDSEFVPWTNVSVGLQNVKELLNQDELNKIEQEVKNAAYDIINRKGATYYGIGMCLVRITDAILGDENAIITVSCFDDENQLFIGSPAIINKQGIQRKAYVNLTKQEQQQLQKSIDIIKSTIEDNEK